MSSIHARVELAEMKPQQTYYCGRMPSISQRRLWREILSIRLSLFSPQGFHILSPPLATHVQVLVTGTSLGSSFIKPGGLHLHIQTCAFDSVMFHGPGS